MIVQQSPLGVMTAVIDNVEPDVGWWYMVTKPGEDKDALLESILPPVNHIFGLHEDTMSIFFLELGWFKRKGRAFVMCNNGYENLKEEINVRSTMEMSKINIDGRGARVYIKLGTTNLTPNTIWNKYKKHPRRSHPPLN